MLAEDAELEDILDALAGLDDELLEMLGALEVPTELAVEELLFIELEANELLVTTDAALDLLEELAGVDDVAGELAALDELTGGTTGCPEAFSILNQLML